MFTSKTIIVAKLQHSCIIRFSLSPEHCEVRFRTDQPNWESWTFEVRANIARLVMFKQGQETNLRGSLDAFQKSNVGAGAQGYIVVEHI